MTEIKITKLPPGRALGAGDLHEWAANRHAGWSGVRGQSDDALRDWAREPSQAERKRARKQRKLKRRNERRALKAHRKTVPGQGDPCPRCGMPTEIREHDGLRDKHLRQPFYYTRWFYCTNKQCKTTMIMPDRYKVERPVVMADSWDDLDAKRADVSDDPLPW